MGDLFKDVKAYRTYMYMPWKEWLQIWRALYDCSRSAECSGADAIDETSGGSRTRWDEEEGDLYTGFDKKNRFGFETHYDLAVTAEVLDGCYYYDFNKIKFRWVITKFKDIYFLNFASEIRITPSPY